MVHIVGVDSRVVRGRHSAVGDGGGGKIVVERRHTERRKESIEIKSCSRDRS